MDRVIFYVTIFALLAGLIVLPVMVIRALLFSGAGTPRTRGETQVLRATTASLWMAALVLLPVVVIAMNLAKVAEDPARSFQDSGSVIAIGTAIAAVALAVWLVWRWRRRCLVNTDDTVTWGRRTESWSDLSRVRRIKTETRASTKVGHTAVSGGLLRFETLELSFGPGKPISITGDLIGLDHFRKEVLARARAMGLKVERVPASGK